MHLPKVPGMDVRDVRGGRYLGDNARIAAPSLSCEESDQAALDLLPAEQLVLDVIAQYKTGREIAESLD